MTKHTGSEKGKCPNCGTAISESVQYCPTCMTDVDSPNVRICRIPDNIDALNKRFDAAKRRSVKDGYVKEFVALQDITKKDSGVVVSMPPSMARKMIEDPNQLYNNYEELVGSSSRIPAAGDNDRHRSAVGAILFGSYAKSIRYGLLSLTEYGLPTYGLVHCRLRAVAIEKRTSFLESNSYTFCEDQELVPGSKLPLGFRACWNNRDRLILCKLGDRLASGQKKHDWQALLVESDGQNRKNDDFIEAHIYGPFDRHAIESMVSHEATDLGRGERLDLDIALHEFAKFQGQLR